MSFKRVVSEKTEASDSDFWRAIDIWFRNPHVVNRRILASRTVLAIETTLGEAELFDLIEGSEVNVDNEEGISGEALLDALNLSESSRLIAEDNFLETLDIRKTYLACNHHLPRNGELFSPAVEFLLLNKGGNRVVGLSKSIFPGRRHLGASFLYEITYDNGVVGIGVLKRESEVPEASVDWFKNCFLPRLLNWSKSSEPRPALRSLALVPTERYAKLYESLKKKYGVEMVRVWPERTDPAKFVYEDVAIAAYLLLLWEKERLERATEELQTFLDLGCGNGLLVYILSGEGHQGRGIDLRNRKIWDQYPSHTRLEVESVVPSSSTKYPGVDWIIGNHSDELTPWIPVIAARSSPNCRYFVLPCCAFEFDGSKYQRRCASKSQYSEYIEYVKSISEGCGFRTEVDRLRIPSTKRICIIGWERASEQDEAETERRVVEMITSKAKLTRSRENQDWSCNFTARDVVEKVRNCTKLDRGLIASVVNNVAEQLLREGRLVTQASGECWNAGRELELRELVEYVPREMLAKLRNECGGLQTLLKNNGHIFKVVGGRVSFRTPGGEDGKRKRRTESGKRAKVRPCWFHQNHPNGCPWPELECNFKH